MAGKRTKILAYKADVLSDLGDSPFHLHPIGVALAHEGKLVKGNFSNFAGMRLKEAQETVDQWVTSIGVRYFSELTNTTILMEEVGEVARIMARKYGDQSFKNSEEEIDLGDEMADVLFVLICLANQTGIDLEEAFRKNIEKKTKRDKDRHKNNEKLK